MAVDKLIPTLIAEPDGVRTRLRDVGAEDRCEHGVGGWAGSDAGKEFLHLADHLVSVPEVRPMVVRVQLSQPGVRDVLGEVTSSLDRGDAIAARMDYQGRYAYRREDATDVDQHVHPQEIFSVAGARAHLHERRPPARDFRVVDLAGGVAIHASNLAPHVLDPTHALLELLFGDSPRIARAPQGGRIAAVDDQTRGAFGIGRGEERRHHTTLGDA